MKAAKFAFFRRVTASCLSAALILTLLALTVAATTAAAQTPIYVPGSASGFLGNPADQANPFVLALTVNGPGKITVTYVSGKVTWNSNGDTTGPDGTTCRRCKGNQTPLDEAHGIGLGKVEKLAALIGVFVPQSKVQSNGFSAIDGTKDAAKVGIIPDGVFFIGRGKTFPVKEAGTLFLGINDYHVSENSGGFNVTVSGP